ncbi:MAG: diacylglycerol kinase family lipid kinase [Geobacter sp.]|nr:diacylglycerol kinase family lipid kinase [Geobacter sp.]
MQDLPRIAHLVINPTAGSYSPRLLDRITSMLPRHGFVPKVLLTGGPDDASLFARRICEEEAEPFIIAGGGDGTINGVVNGLTPGRATLAVLPLGTSNVLARELGIASVDDALRRIERGTTRIMSVGLLEKEGLSRYFLLMAGIGFDGAVVEGVRLGEKRILKEGAYILSALRRLISWEREPVEVTADDRTILCHTVVVCNSAKYAGTFALAPEGDIFTPGFQLVCITGSSRWTYLKASARLVFGMGAGGSGVELVNASEVVVSGTKAVQIDGDYLCHAPVRIRAVPDFVRLVV